MKNSEEENDRDLRERFARQRRGDRALAPSFARLTRIPQGATPPRSRSRFSRVGLAFGLPVGIATVAVVIGLALRESPPSLSPGPEIDVAIVNEVLEWESPTRFLLEPVWQPLAALPSTPFNPVAP